MSSHKHQIIQVPPFLLSAVMQIISFLKVVFLNLVHQPIGHQVQVQNTAQQSRQPAGEPIFVAVPPKPQRLLHSEAYIK